MNHFSSIATKRVDPLRPDDLVRTQAAMTSNVRFDGPIARVFFRLTHWERNTDLAAPIGQTRGARPASSLVELAGTPTPLAEAA